MYYLMQQRLLHLNKIRCQWAFFMAEIMTDNIYEIYEKPYKSPPDIINMLINKGLIVTDTTAARIFLENINYYRFKIYLRPFYNDSTKNYHPNSCFNNGVDLYRFDEDLRNLLFSIISKLEIKLRTRLDQKITSFTGNPFWYLDNTLFLNRSSVDNCLLKLASEFHRSKDEFSNHFKEKYINNSENHNYKQLPPFWMLAELATFGNILTLYKEIDKEKFNSRGIPNQLDTLAKEFGANNIKTLNSWLGCIRDVRNRCAHHSRIWNSNYRNPSGINQ